MAKQAFLCKYAEIGIKGKNRYKFENALCEQIRRMDQAGRGHGKWKAGR